MTRVTPHSISAAAASEKRWVLYASVGVFAFIMVLVLPAMGLYNLFTADPGEVKTAEVPYRPVHQTLSKPDPMARCDQRVRRVTVGAEDHTFNPPGHVICYARWFRRSAEGCLEVRDNFGKVLKNDCTNREDLAGQSPAKFRASGAGTVVVDYVLCKEDDPSRQYLVADGCPIPAQRTAGR